MGDEATADADAAFAALRAGDWQVARDALVAAADLAATGEVHFGLGIASWWLGETEASLRSWGQAYVAFRRDADHAQAALAAFYLCLAHRMSLGNDAAANGWLERAAKLVEAFDLAPVAGWVHLARAYTANDSDDPERAAELARLAITSGEESDDVDLVLCATAELGAALVASGQVEQGAALLDQAMAAALAGEAGDLDSVVLVSCRTITACSRAADVKRAMQWIRAADDFHRRFGSTHLYTTCRTHHGGVLFAAGDWRRAEDELGMALRAGGTGDIAVRAEAAAKLAELRVAQGRLAEAQELLAGLEDHPTTTFARARLHATSGEHAVAAALGLRRLQRLPPRHVERAILLDLLADVGVGDVATEGAADDEDDGSIPAAYRMRAMGRRRAGGDPAALGALERALAIFGSFGMPYECARTRMLVAHAVSEVDRATAINEARIALRAFDQLGATRDADAAASLLRALGSRAARTSPRNLGTLTRREQEILGLLGEGLSNPAIAERLFISRRTVEHHVANVLVKLGLSGRAEAAAHAARLDRGSAPS